MSTNVPGFVIFQDFCIIYIMAKLVTSSIRVKGELKPHIHISLYGSNYVVAHGLSQQGVWVSFWTPKPLKSTPQDTQHFLRGIS